MIRITYGGISIPRVPPAAIDAVESRSRNPYLRICGIATFDMVATVARELPQIAEKPANAQIVAMESPPRRWP